jgi:voltage-gated potassium channel
MPHNAVQEVRFSPDHPFRSWWSAVLLFTLLYVSIEIPIRFVLGYELSSWLLLGELWITAIYSIDIFINLNTGYFERGHYVHEPSKVRKHYLKGWFWIDLLSAIPFEYLSSLVDLELSPLWNFLFHAFRVGRLLHLTEFLDALHILSRRFMLIPMVERMIIFGVAIILATHWISCGWMSLHNVGRESDSLNEYVNALYWAVATLATVGYGDMVPENIPQKLYTILVMFLGVGMYGYIIGNLATLFSQMDRARMEHTETLNQVTSYLKYRGVGKNTQRRVRDFFTIRWERGYGHHGADLLNELPPSLHGEVALQLNREILERVPIFAHATPEFIQSLAVQLKPRLFRPGDTIIHVGGEADCMYFINRGAVDVFLAGHDEAVTTLKEGSFFGEMALLSDKPRSATVKAMEYTDTYYLDRSSFTLTLAAFPEFAAEMKREAAQREKKQRK